MKTDAEVLCDTGVISRYLTRVPEVLEKIMEIDPDNIRISVVTRTELLNWLGNYRGLEKKTRVKLLREIKSLPIVHFNRDISEIYSTLSDRDMVAKPADLLIGATAKYHDMPLYTLNRKDFVKFGIQLVD